MRPAVDPLEVRTLLSAGTRGVLFGQVTGGGAPLPRAEVALFQTGTEQARPLGRARTGPRGWYAIPYQGADPEAALYVVASGGPGVGREVQLLSVAGEAEPNGRPGAHAPRRVQVNELTTVASVYALGPFLSDTRIVGPDPGLSNAVATVSSLVDARTGAAGEVIASQVVSVPGVSATKAFAPSTEALETLSTLANILAAAVVDAGARAALFDLTTPTGGAAPDDTIEALRNIVRDPAGRVDALFGLSRLAPRYGPALEAPPVAWTLALHHTRGGFNAPGRLAFDARGNVWANNNFALNTAVPPDPVPGPQITVLDPLGEPILGSDPDGIQGGGVRGVAFGVAVAPDGSAWYANYADSPETGRPSSISRFLPDGTPASPPTGFLQTGDPEVRIDHPQGIAFDQRGNLWIPNHGDPSDLTDLGSVTVYPGGDPERAVSIRPILPGRVEPIIKKPFSIAIDGEGRAWVANAGLVGGSVTILEFDEAAREIRFVKEVTGGGLDELPRRHELGFEFYSPKGIAIDSQGNAWVSNFLGGVTFIDGDIVADDGIVPQKIAVPGLFSSWGIAIDASDRVYVADLVNETAAVEGPSNIFVLRGVDPAAGAPAGTTPGDLIARITSETLQHLTGVQVDASGNVWAVNNIALGSNLASFSGGDGLVQFIGLATPVATPLLGPPERPGARPAEPTPAGAEDFYRMRTGSILSVGPDRGVLANDRPGVGPARKAVLDTPPPVGTLVLSPGGALRYRPPRGFQGEVTFTYRHSEGGRLGPPIGVTIDVRP